MGGGGGGGGTPPRQQLTCPRHGARRDSSAAAGGLRGAAHRPRVGTAASGTAPVPHRAALPSPPSLPAPVPPRRRDGKARWKKSYGSCRRRRRGASTGPSRRAAPGPSVRAGGAGRRGLGWAQRIAGQCGAVRGRLCTADGSETSANLFCRRRDRSASSGSRGRAARCCDTGSAVRGAAVNPSAPLSGLASWVFRGRHGCQWHPDPFCVRVVLSQPLPSSPFHKSR